MIFDKKTNFFIFLQFSTLFTNIQGGCPWSKNSVYAVEHGYINDFSNLKIDSDNTATGYYDIQCRSGYRLDSTIGRRVTCLESGEWSKPLPKCISMGFCLIQPLFDFIETAPGITLDKSQTFILTNVDNDTVAIGGSNITLQCRSGYANIGGSLTITCEENNNWTTFPNCVSTSNETTTKAPVRCSYNDSVLQFENGYVSASNNFLIYNDNAATGSVLISCRSGYKMDPGTEGVFSCNEGVWSSRPSCTKAKRCSLAFVNYLLTDSALNNGLKIVSQSITLASDNENDVLIGSFILFECQDGFSNKDENLTFRCQEDGQWSSYPVCSED